VHGEDAVTLAYGKKFDERVHGEDALMPTLEGKSAEVLRLALGRYASSRFAQDDKQIGEAAGIGGLRMTNESGTRQQSPTLAQGKKFDHRGHGENSLMTTFQGESAGVLRLALGRFASSRVAQDDKQIR
jgi:hypothetical protein